MAIVRQRQHSFLLFFAVDKNIKKFQKIGIGKRQSCQKDT